MQSKASPRNSSMWPITWPPGPELLEKENSTVSLGTLTFTNWVAHVRASSVSCSVTSLEIIGGLGRPGRASFPWNFLDKENKDLWNFRQLLVQDKPEESMTATAILFTNVSVSRVLLVLWLPPPLTMILFSSYSLLASLLHQMSLSVTSVSLGSSSISSELLWNFSITSRDGGVCVLCGMDLGYRCCAHCRQEIWWSKLSKWY